MTVKELREQISDLPEGAEVVFRDPDDKRWGRPLGEAAMKAATHVGLGRYMIDGGDARIAVLTERSF